MTTTKNKAIHLEEPVRDRSRSIGAILVEQGRLTDAEVEQIQEFAASHNQRFGDAALSLGLLTPRDIDVAIAKQFNYPVLQRGGENGVSDEVIAAYLPQSDIIEPLRALRSQLMLRWPKDAEQKTVVVASPNRGDGRSWLAANLATVFAQLGERTLLIDADMRNPQQHKFFNLNNSIGLSALLTGRAGREIVRRIHPQLRLFVLPAGSLPPNPQELLGRPVFELILGLFSKQFDLIVIDTPAAALSSDAQILASRAGSAIMLARQNHTQQRDLYSTLQTFQQSGVKVLGCVFNSH